MPLHTTFEAFSIIDLSIELEEFDPDEKPVAEGDSVEEKRVDPIEDNQHFPIVLRRARLVKKEVKNNGEENGWKEPPKSDIRIIRMT